jgi:hypothetical protein
VYKIREVDASDDPTAETLKDLHEQTFLDHAKLPSFEEGHWWLAHLGTEPVGFAGVVKSPLIPSAATSSASESCKNTLEIGSKYVSCVR